MFTLENIKKLFFAVIVSVCLGGFVGALIGTLFWLLFFALFKGEGWGNVLTAFWRGVIGGG